MKIGTELIVHGGKMEALLMAYRDLLPLERQEAQYRVYAIAEDCSGVQTFPLEEYKEFAPRLDAARTRVTELEGGAG